MSKSNNSNRTLWLVTSKIHHFVIAATSKKDCKELIDELAEETIDEKFSYVKIGNICPTLPYFDNWNGESVIIISNF